MIAAANTGKDNKSNTAVINTDQTKRGNRWLPIPNARMLKIVVIKLIAPAIEDAPATCRAKIAMSTEPPGWNWTEANGG